MCATNRLGQTASSTQRAVPSCARGSATALGQMSAKPPRSGPSGPRQLPMTPASARRKPALTSAGHQILVVHALAPTRAPNTIPYLWHRPGPHTPRLHAGLGQFNYS